MTTKVCTRCHGEKPATAENFYTYKSAGKVLLRPECKPCRREIERVIHWEKRHPGVPCPPVGTVISVPPGRTRTGYSTDADVRRAWNAQYQRDRRSANPGARMAHYIRVRMADVLNGRAKPGATFDLLGYTPDDLVRHIERTWKPGMTWANYGDWHVDHILPVVLFDHADPDQIRQCWALSNLRALWKPENLEKSDRRLHLV